MNQHTIHSWGNYSKPGECRLHTPAWRHDDPFVGLAPPFLAYGQGRSYGDSCFNTNGTIILTKKLNRLIQFDKDTGILECESGVLLADILSIVEPHGWFLPVLPGTQFVSVGGAIANDIHGKNHHKAGTFGCHVISFDLLRSNGERLLCSSQQYPMLYRATIGGLGLTGMILSAKLQLKMIHSSGIIAESVPFQNIQSFFDLAHASEEKFEYTVAWIDCLAREKNSGRGIFIRGNHADESRVQQSPPKMKTKLTIPSYFPNAFLNPLSIRLFNSLYFHQQSAKKEPKMMPYDQFFFPLDSVKNWNKIYGRRGFLQYQFVLPQQHAFYLHDILKTIALAKQGSFLAVLKTFGPMTSPGLMSFPMHGVTLALDIPYRGMETLNLLNTLDAMIVECGGRVYPAKDARMSAITFKACYREYDSFMNCIDPQFSSSFWTRVMKHVE